MVKFVPGLVPDGRDVDSEDSTASLGVIVGPVIAGVLVLAVIIAVVVLLM